MKLIMKKRHTQIAIWKKDLETFKPLVDLYLVKYGGTKLKESPKKVYYEIYADLMNRDRGKGGS